MAVRGVGGVTGLAAGLLRGGDAATGRPRGAALATCGVADAVRLLRGSGVAMGLVGWPPGFAALRGAPDNCAVVVGLLRGRGVTGGLAG